MIDIDLWEEREFKGLVVMEIEQSLKRHRKLFISNFDLACYIYRDVVWKILTVHRKKKRGDS